MIDVTETDGIALVTMRHGKANAADIAFCEALTQRIERMRDSPVRAIVLTGQGRVFSAGVDMPQMLAGGAGYVRTFLPALDRLYETLFDFPKPVVAAINGHAIAGGCILACCADRRLMVREGGRMGITEILVGVPFPPVSFEVMRSATADRFLAAAMLTGDTVTPQDAKERGWVHSLVEPEQLVDKALAEATFLASLSPAAYAMTKRQLHQPFHERLAREGEALARQAMDIWTAAPTLARMESFVSATLRKS